MFARLKIRRRGATRDVFASGERKAKSFDGGERGCVRTSVDGEEREATKARAERGV